MARSSHQTARAFQQRYPPATETISQQSRHRLDAGTHVRAAVSSTTSRVVSSFRRTRAQTQLLQSCDLFFKPATRGFTQRHALSRRSRTKADETEKIFGVHA